MQANILQQSFTNVCMCYLQVGTTYGLLVFAVRDLSAVNKNSFTLGQTVLDSVAYQRPNVDCLLSSVYETGRHETKSGFVS